VANISTILRITAFASSIPRIFPPAGALPQAFRLPLPSCEQDAGLPEFSETSLERQARPSRERALDRGVEPLVREGVGSGGG
jgi:hypothetical protein